ncbi:hypothetical protein [Saccharothrix violaceirubra]|uniref:Uncharacterized protein n=1 Tax=Saccharothrix violaceirubra TaxID=413306 RepID=A0A7W7SZQ0_9PSEU|nr:hypothetical protein [Saccharothrix violaceirubra]MBB4963312.1 hypothetical protein [Saccharothrix violaceirubra]
MAARLYALPPAAFVAARTSFARAAKGVLAKEITALRKPSLAAWALNSLSRTDTLRPLSELAVALHSAQSAGRGDELRVLDVERRRLISDLTREATASAALSGYPLGPSAVAQVRATLSAALATTELLERLCAGRLVKAEEASGFGPLPVVPAPSSDSATSTSPSTLAATLTAARHALADATSALTDASHTRAEAERVHAEAERALRAARTAEAEAYSRVVTARDHVTQTEALLSGFSSDPHHAGNTER